jgi:methylmalonyl-CoA mutase N-terminal domain/subunit
MNLCSSRIRRIAIPKHRPSSAIGSMTTEGRQPLSIPLFAREFKEAHAAEAQECIENLRRVASEGGNVFECIMGDVFDRCTLGQITEALMQSVGQFRRDL